jgi:omega-6 fatty acid desaturase (delta-12 desaturase)
MTVLNTTSELTQASLAPSTFTLPDILRTLPRECFQQDWHKAWTALAVNVLCVVLSYWALVISPWYCLPFTWVLTGTSLTGFFVLAHDCGHRSFAKRRWVNDLVGHVLMLPLLYPFHGWRILHNFHHKHTNKLAVDNAWQPFEPEFYLSVGQPTQWVYRQMRGYFWWLASIVHWVMLHFNWQAFEGKERERVKLSALTVIIFAAIAFPLLFINVGFWGVVKFWLMPWLVYHFWMSTFTWVHHTAPHVQFKPAEQWNAAEAQLMGTIHCDYPRWIEFLCHDINVHVPHHISTAIPSYRLRMAHQSLLQNWGSYITSEQFSWKLITQIADQCHLYEPERCYQSFKEFHSRSHPA